MAALDADVNIQGGIIKAGAIPPLVAMLRTGSAAAQAFAAQATANAAAYNADAQKAIAKLGSIPLLLALLASGKAQTPAACALARLACDNAEIQHEISEAGGIAPLLALLNGLDVEAQVQAAAALSEMANDNRQTQAAIAKAGGIGPLLSLLQSRSSAAQSQGMAALAALACNNGDNQDAIARSGGVRPLVLLLENSGNDSSVASSAAYALMEISKANAANQKTVVDNGGISQLATLIKTSNNAKVKSETAGALWSLSEDPEIKVAIAQASTIQPLVGLLGSGDNRGTLHAANALASLGLNNTENQESITQMLIELLMTGPQEAQVRAVQSLNELVKENPTAHEDIAKAGNPSALVELVKTGISEAKDFSLWALSLSISADNQGIVADAGGVQPLIDHLADTREFIKEQAAAALAKLAHENESTRAMVTAAGGVKPLIGLITATEEESTEASHDEDCLTSSELVRQNAAHALSNLAVDPAARDEIVGDNGIPPLVKLLQDEGHDTKKYAATAIARLSNAHEATQAAFAQAGAISPLVELLDGKQGAEAQEEAAGAILALADHEGNRLAITESGGIGFLVMLLGCDNPRAREHAEGALVCLSMENANRVLIIKKLVDMLQDSGAAAQEQAAAALANLARESEDNRKSIVDANGIVPLLEVLESTSAKAKENAVGAIKELCRNSKNNQSLIAKAGGIPKLVGVMIGFSGNTLKEQALIHLCTLAASAIKEMSKGNRKNQDAIAEAGAIAPLVAMLGALSPQMQANAAGALANLANNHMDNQSSIARTGAVAPLCTLVREGSEETRDESAWAIWSLATDHPQNKDTIAKLGGIDPLLSLLVTGNTERSQECVAGALAALAAKHLDNRQVIAKRLVGLLGSSAVRVGDRAERVLLTCSSFTSDSAANQVAIAKNGGIAPLINWLASVSLTTAAHAAQTALCLVTDNNTTQLLFAKSDGIPPLIALVRRSSPEAQEFAARAIWHLASQVENRGTIVEAAGIKPLIAMLATDGEIAPELAAIILVRLARSNADVCVEIADRDGIFPLVKLLSAGSAGAQTQAACCLAELGLVAKNRDKIANAGGIEPTINLLTSQTLGTPETAARVLAHLAHEDPKRVLKPWEVEEEVDPSQINGSAERRNKIRAAGGIKKLISMLDGSNLGGTRASYERGFSSGSQGDEKKGALGLKEEAGMKIGMNEQGAIALADIAHANSDMQFAIIDDGGVPPLLAFIRTGSQLGQEHAARAIWNLATITETHQTIVESGAIPDLVQLLKTGSPKAQEMAAAAVSELAFGAVKDRQEKATVHKEAHRLERAQRASEERERRASAEGERRRRPSVSGERRRRPSVSSNCSMVTDDEGINEEAPAPAAEEESSDEEIDSTDRLVAIADAGGILPLVALLSSGTVQARENAAGALWHLALDKSNQSAIARVNGISPLVTILDDGTVAAHKHAADALARLAIKNPDNQAQIAKHCVALLANPSVGAQTRSARVLRDLAASNPGSPVVIVNAGAISPLVTLLSTGAAEVKEEAAGALSTLAFNSPSTQLAIASGLVVLVGTGSGESQEHVSHLLITLARDPENCVAIAKAGAIPRLVVQLRGGGRTTVKAQELAAAVLSYLSSSEDSIKAIAASNGIRPLVTMLTAGTSAAQAHAASVLSDMARSSSRNQSQIISEGGIAPLVNLLAKENNARTKAAAAGALRSLSSGQPDTQKAVADAGAIKPLVVLLNEDDDNARKKAAGALAAICLESHENQDAVEKNKGISKLVGLLDTSMSEGVNAEAAAALAVLARGNEKIQDRVPAAGGTIPLVSLLSGDAGEHAKEEAAAALWSLSTKHYANQVAIADAGGIAPLVAALGLESVRGQEQAAGALAALALDNTKNELSIAKLIVSLLGSDDKQASAKAARAISHLARAHASNQRSIATSGGLSKLVELLDVTEGGVGAGVLSGSAAVAALESAKVQKEITSAIWSMSTDNTENQVAIAQAGGVQPLIRLLEGHPEVHREVAGALWSLAANHENQLTIANEGGIPPLVDLLKTGSPGAQETAAGAIHVLAESSENRVAIAAQNGIPLLVALFDGGSEEAIKQASGALKTLALQNVSNQLAIANELVAMLRTGSASAQEHITELLRTLAQDPDNRSAIAKAGAVPELVRQLETGSERAMGMAASALALIALKSAEHRATVTNELVKLLGSNKEAVRQRASEALTDMAADESAAHHTKKSVSTGGVAPLVNLLKDGLKDGRVEAQEYALRSLLSVTDAAGKEMLVGAGCIKPLIQSLLGGKLSAIAQEHCATVLSGLAPIGENANSIKEHKGIDPLVTLLSTGNVDAKAHAAATLAQLALRAEAALDIAKAGAVSAFVQWLVNPTLGPPEVAARALSEIALDNTDTQSQIAEEGAISPLVAMVGTPVVIPEGNNSIAAANKAAAAALKVSNVASGALATLAKDNIINQLMITEDGGIPPLVELLKAKTSVHKSDSYKYPTKALWHLAANEDNQSAIAKAGGIVPLVGLLTSENEVTAQYAAAALQSLAQNNTENQIALAKAGAITPLVDLLGTDSTETQEHAVGALLSLASQDANSRNAVVQRLVAVLDMRNAAAQMKAAEALAVLAAKSDENRKTITAAQAIEPLVRILGDGRRVRSATPQERAAAVLSDLARTGDNKKTIVDAGGVNPLVAMLSSDSPEARMHAAGALGQLAALGNNKNIIVAAGAIPLLVKLLGSEAVDAQKYATGALWHLASSADNKTQMVAAGAIPLLVEVLGSRDAVAREHATAVVSALARSQGGNKKAIYMAGGVRPLVGLLNDSRAVTQKHAACALWGLSDGKDGIYDKQIAETGAIPLLVAMLQYDDPETRGFAAACLLCLCKDPSAHPSILESGGVEPLQALCYGPATWLRGQVMEMLTLLGIPLPDPDILPTHLPAPPSPKSPKGVEKGVPADETETGSPHKTRPSSPGRGEKSGRQPLYSARPSARFTQRDALQSARPLTGTARMKFHFFSFQIHGTTGYMGNA